MRVLEVLIVAVIMRKSLLLPVNCVWVGCKRERKRVCVCARATHSKTHTEGCGFRGCGFQKTPTKRRFRGCFFWGGLGCGF